MRKMIRAFMLVAVAIGFSGALAIDTASAADTVQVRQSVMKELSGHNKAIKKYLKGHKDPKKEARLGTPGDIEFRATAMAGLAKRMTMFFPKGSGPGMTKTKTYAKDAIWSDWAGFQAAAGKLAEQAAKLEAAAATGDKKNIAAAMKTFGKIGCGTCHKTFRTKKPKKKKMKKAS